MLPLSTPCCQLCLLLYIKQYRTTLRLIYVSPFSANNTRRLALLKSALFRRITVLLEPLTALALRFSVTSLYLYLHALTTLALSSLIRPLPISFYSLSRTPIQNTQETNVLISKKAIALLLLAQPTSFVIKLDKTILLKLQLLLLSKLRILD